MSLKSRYLSSSHTSSVKFSKSSLYPRHIILSRLNGLNRKIIFAKNGKRFRSLGCAPSTFPVESNADTVDKIIEELKTTKVAERSGRSQDKEDGGGLETLRRGGYM